MITTLDHFKNAFYPLFKPKLILSFS